MTDYSAFGAATTTGQGAGAGAGLVWQNDSGAYTFGQRFRVDTAGLSATKIRFYVPSGSPSAPTTGYYVGLYEVGGSGSPVSSAGPISGVTVGAWNEVAITPFALVSGGDYVAAALFPGGYYSAQTPNAVPWDVAGPINFYGSGVYNAGASLTYPNTASGSFPSYGMDVVVSDGASGIDASGTAALDATTAAGTATISYDAGGTAAGDATTASGTATISYDVSGAAALDATTAAGTVTLPISASGTAALGATTASGTITGPVAGRSSTRISRLIARLWFAESVTVERLQGAGAYGNSYASSVATAAAIDHSDKLVLTATGDSLISAARVFLPIDTDDVPSGSRITLPDAHGGRAHEVVAVAVHLSGQATPDHVELSLL